MATDEVTGLYKCISQITCRSNNVRAKARNVLVHCSIDIFDMLLYVYCTLFIDDYMPIGFLESAD